MIITSGGLLEDYHNRFALDYDIMSVPNNFARRYFTARAFIDEKCMQISCKKLLALNND